jgi:hypothetical protein
MLKAPYGKIQNVKQMSAFELSVPQSTGRDVCIFQLQFCSLWKRNDIAIKRSPKDTFKLSSFEENVTVIEI